jgi:hypothetical protein
MVLGVQVGARVDEPLDDGVIVLVRRIHQGRPSASTHGGALRRGLAPISGTPRIGYAQYPPQSSLVWLGVPGGSRIWVL